MRSFLLARAARGRPRRRARERRRRARPRSRRSIRPGARSPRAALLRLPRPPGRGPLFVRRAARQRGDRRRSRGRRRRRRAMASFCPRPAAARACSISPPSSPCRRPNAAAPTARRASSLWRRRRRRPIFALGGYAGASAAPRGARLRCRAAAPRARGGAVDAASRASHRRAPHRPSPWRAPACCSAPRRPASRRSTGLSPISPTSPACSRNVAPRGATALPASWPLMAHKSHR